MWLMAGPVCGVPVADSCKSVLHAAQFLPVQIGLEPNLPKRENINFDS